MKALSKLSFLILIIVAVFSTACIINPTHYLDDYGVCKQCKEDVSITLNYNDGVYSSSARCLDTDYTYFKFTSISNQPLQITIDKGDATIDDLNCIKFYSKNNHNISLSHFAGEFTWNYPYELTQGETYYIRLAVKKVGTVSISVSHVNAN